MQSSKTHRHRTRIVAVIGSKTKKSLPIALIPINLLDSKPDKQGTANNLQPTNRNRRPPHDQANSKEPMKNKR
jgi:hypothetical protein